MRVRLEDDGELSADRPVEALKRLDYSDKITCETEYGTIEGTVRQLISKHPVEDGYSVVFCVGDETRERFDAYDVGLLLATDEGGGMTLQVDITTEMGAHEIEEEVEGDTITRHDPYRKHFRTEVESIERVPFEDGGWDA